MERWYVSPLPGLLVNSVLITPLVLPTTATSNYANIPLGKVLPIASCFVTTAADHQMEHTLSPGNCALAKYNNQPGIQYSGVHPTASSGLSLARTLLSVLHLDRLNTNSVVKVPICCECNILKPDSKINQPSVTVWIHSDKKFNCVSCLGLPTVQFRNNGTWQEKKATDD